MKFCGDSLLFESLNYEHGMTEIAPELGTLIQNHAELPDVLNSEVLNDDLLGDNYLCKSLY